MQTTLPAERYDNDKYEIITNPNNIHSSQEQKSLPPPTLPKPRGATVSQTTAEFEARSAPSHILRRPPSPIIAQDTGAPVIDIGLVGKDRYDQQSKAFSYVPARALRDHFSAPRKTTRLVQRIEDMDGNEISWPHVPEPVQSPAPPTGSSMSYHSTAGPSRETPLHLISQNIRATQPSPAVSITPSIQRRKTKFANYRTLDDYSSDMDDLCDPDFYMTYEREHNVPQQQVQKATTSGGGAQNSMVFGVK